MAWSTNGFALEWGPQPFRTGGERAYTEFGSYAVTYMAFARTWYVTYWGFDNERRQFDEYFNSLDEGKRFVETEVTRRRNEMLTCVQTAIAVDASHFGDNMPNRVAPAATKGKWQTG